MERMIMRQHKHCRKCGNMIVQPKYDEEIADLPKEDKAIFHREVCYNNGFCTTCVLEYGLFKLCNWFYRGDKI